MKNQLSKEKLLIKILGSFSETKNIEEIKRKLVTETGKALDLQICSIYDFDETVDNMLPVDKYGEYLNPVSKIPSDVGNKETIKNNTDIISILKKKKEIFASSTEELISKYQIINYKDELIESLKTENIEAQVILPIVYSDKLLGAFTIGYNYKKFFKKKNWIFSGYLLRSSEQYYTKQNFMKEKKIPLKGKKY